MDVEAVDSGGVYRETSSEISRRAVAEIEGMESRTDGTQSIQVKVPLADMFGYATALRSMTQGRGTFTMEFDHYAPASKEVADAIIRGGR